MNTFARTLIWLTAPLLALLGCDGARLAQLRVGESTEADVQARFGTPTEVYQLADGARQLEFSRQPEGVTNYMLTIGPDGKLRSMVQTLQPEMFAKVNPGLSQAEVRQLLGRPASQRHFALKSQDLWEWRWQDGSDNKFFDVTFDAQGRVVASSVTEDRRNRH
jgi:outer membrane protein assembly factor BamE (lipoprotein component of BamABCDE complex)